MSILSPQAEVVEDSPAPDPGPQGNLPLAPTAGRANHFNLFRLILAGLVLLSHSTTLVDNGDEHREILIRLFHSVSLGSVAVDGFFLLSGFLIVQSWVRDPNAIRFLKKRVLRIYPAFIVASFLSIFLVGRLAASSAHFYHDLNYTSLFKNMLLLKPPKVLNVFDGTFMPVVNNAMWTIRYEFQCYLIVMALGLLGVLRRRVLWLTFSIGVLAFFIFLRTVQGHVFMGHAFDPIDRPGMYSFLLFFVAGGCFYLYQDKLPTKPAWLLLAGAVLFACMFQETTAMIALATVGAYLFFWLAFVRVPHLSTIKFPDISYGLYLYGWPTQKLLLWYWPSMSASVLLVLSVAIAVLAGWVSWELVESPFLRMKPHVRAAELPDEPTGDVGRL